MGTFDCSIPMWKLVTGEPYAGKSHVRFGGRGGAEPSLPLSRSPQDRAKLFTNSLSQARLLTTT